MCSFKTGVAIETGNCELVKMVLEEVDQNGKIKDGKILSVRYNTQFNLDFQCLLLCVYWHDGLNNRNKIELFYLSHTRLYRDYITSSEMYSLHLTHPK